MPFADAKYPPAEHKPYIVVLGRIDCGFKFYGPFASPEDANKWVMNEGVSHGCVLGHSCWVPALHDPASLGKEVMCLT